MIDSIHSRALEVSARYRQAEADLIAILQEIESHRVFLRHGHSSLYSYVTSELRLSDNTAYDLITVARKARQVPALHERLRDGSLTLSKARRVAAVITLSNQEEWLTKGSTLTSRQLEREIARVRPETATRERATYVSGDRVRLELGMSEREMLRLRRAQDLLSQARKRPVSLEETIAVMTGEFLKRNDPLERAKRYHVKNPSAPVKTLGTGRVPAEATHAVNLRDGRRCAHVNAGGRRCNETRWLDIHHILPRSKGGTNAIDNLITLCSAHHKLQHLGA